MPLGEELKASLATPKQRKWILGGMASQDVSIVAIIVDKRQVRRMPDDPEDWYRAAVGRATHHCVRHWPEFKLVLDKRYTKVALRDRLEAAIREDLGNPGITIEQVDSRASLGLQIADFVAWAIHRKYEADDTAYCDLLEGKVSVEEIIEAK